MKIREALALGRDYLSRSDSPVLDARLLLMDVTQASHSYLIAHDDEGLSPAQEVTYRQLLQRARQGEPIPYLVGQAPFYGRTFRVSPAVLIPRPETELLVQAALRWAAEAGPHQLRAVDVGTGSGCLAITLALHLANALIEATEVSPAALAIALENAHRHDVAARIHFHPGSLLAPISGRVDMVVANLPYVADHEWTSLDDSVKWYEPELALRGGPDGLDAVDQLLAQAKDQFAPGGAIFMEIGWQQGAQARLLAESHFPKAQVEVQKDDAGHDRIVIVRT